MKLIFDPPSDDVAKPLPAGMAAAGDRRDESVYVYDERIILAVNVALAADRPLLVSGPPGSGKSSLALNVAGVLGWGYVEEVITPRTQAQDLLWRFDALRRLRDAQADKLKDDEAYVLRGALWRAFEPDDGRRTVVLLDEIDKADPDVPNSLLVALGSLTFDVTDIEGLRVDAKPEQLPFVILTTNAERELPRAFMRRCVLLELRPPDENRLLDIAEIHGLKGDGTLARRAAALFVELAEDEPEADGPKPSTAEYIDALRACRELGLTADSPEWKQVARLALKRPSDADPST